jgi:hypothetical protein
METEGSLPRSQEPSTGPYPEPDGSNPYNLIPLRSILILSTHLRLGLPSGPFPSGFLTNILYAFLLSYFWQTLLLVLIPEGAAVIHEVQDVNKYLLHFPPV